MMPGYANKDTLPRIRGALCSRKLRPRVPCPRWVIIDVWSAVPPLPLCL
jgi:hypothetical protein